MVEGVIFDRTEDNPFLVRVLGFVSYGEDDHQLDERGVTDNTNGGRGGGVDGQSQMYGIQFFVILFLQKLCR